MRLPDVAFLAADTARSRAYAQAMAHAGMTLGSVMVVRAPGTRRWGQHPGPIRRPQLPGLFVPDLEVELAETARSLSGSLRFADTGTLNSPEVVEWIERVAPRLVVFSGFGGEIVERAVLRAGAPLLHLHGGWLPEERGSTTGYYAVLEGRSFAVSAILLDERIDGGPIVARRRYPRPPAGTDVDYGYDPVIRADCLVRTLQRWREDGGFEQAIEQDPAEGVTYYVIHPLLKHLALQALASPPASAPCPTAPRTGGRDSPAERTSA